MEFRNKSLMRILFLTLILLTGSLNHSVLADDNIPNQPIQKVDSTSLHLLGGGIENRKTNEIIALGCVNQQCNELRLVYLTSTLDEAYFFGPIIQ